MSYGGVGGLTGGLGFLGQYIDYEYSRKLQHDSQDFSEQMDSTKHQREVADLKAAGLNPILSTKFGSSAPTSGIAHVGSNNIGNALVNSAQTMKAQAEKKVRLGKGVKE